MNLGPLFDECAARHAEPAGVSLLDGFFEGYAPNSTDRPHYYRVLYRLAPHLRQYCELGVYAGWACLHVAWHGAEVYAVDVRNDLCPEAQNHPRIHFFKARSDDPQIPPQVPLLDAIFIDNDHSYASTKATYELWRPKVRDGGLVLFDDIDSTNAGYGCGQFFDEIQGHKRRLSELHAGGWGFGVEYV